MRPLAGGIGRPATATYPSGAELRPRTLDVHELMWVVAGAATLRTPDRSRELLPGDVVLLPPAVPHGFSWDGTGGCVHGYVHAELTGDAPAVARGRPLDGLCAYLTWLGLREPPGWRDRALEVAGLVAGLVVAGPLPTGARPVRPRALDDVLAELRRRWGAGPPLPPVRIAGLADAVHLTPAHLGRTARAHWGRPLSTLLEQLRLSRAEQLLTGTSATVGAVARLCGYADAFHCSRRFSAAHGMPPARWRADPERRSVLDDPVVRELAAEVWTTHDALG
jgi:AraC family transcriptional regulator